MKKGKIVVIGSYVIDLSMYTPRFPVDGETVLGEKMKVGSGGKGSNQATAAHRAGAEVIMVTKIGNDSLSNIPMEHYTKEKMCTDYIYRSSEVGTGNAIIEINIDSGENRIIIDKGANSFLTVEEVRKAEKEIESCDLVLMQLEINIDVVKEGIRLAKKYNKKIVLNPAPLQEIPENLFDGVDYITPNETEAEYFAKCPVKTVDDARIAADKLLKAGAKNVVITLGKAGAFLKNAEKEELVPTKTIKAVDTTGAGDAFNGGFCVAICEGKDIVEAVKFGNCTATLSVTREGTSYAMPTREEIDALYNEFYAK